VTSGTRDYSGTFAAILAARMRKASNVDAFITAATLAAACPVLDGRARGQQRTRTLIPAHDNLEHIFSGRLWQLGMPKSSIMSIENGHRADRDLTTSERTSSVR
jgi:hypothetical protein